MEQFAQVRACRERLDRVSVVGLPLSVENAQRVQELIVKYVPWLEGAQMHLHASDNYTFTLKPKDMFLTASKAEQLDMFEELLRKLLHYLGRNFGNTSLSFSTVQQ